MTADWEQLGADALTPWQEAIVELHERLSGLESLLDNAARKALDRALSKDLSRATTWQSERDCRDELQRLIIAFDRLQQPAGRLPERNFTSTQILQLANAIQRARAIAF